MPRKIKWTDQVENVDQEQEQVVVVKLGLVRITKVARSDGIRVENAGELWRKIWKEGGKNGKRKE